MDTCTRAEERVTSSGEKKRKNENNDDNYGIRLIERTNGEKPVNAFKSFASGREPGTRPVRIVVVVGTRRRRRPTRDNNYRTRAGKFPVGSPNDAVSGRNGRRGSLQKKHAYSSCAVFNAARLPHYKVAYGMKTNKTTNDIYIYS